MMIFFEGTHSGEKRTGRGGPFIAGVLAVLMTISLAPLAPRAGNGPAAEERFREQTTCPVMGGEVDTSLYVDMQGQRVYVCCKACTNMFGKDPDRYFEKAAADSVLFENVQEVCPVSGEPLKEKDSELFMYYQGRGLYFCCEGCMERFRKEPGKYLEKMDGMRGKTMKEGGMKGGGAHGHGGEEAAGGCGASALPCRGASGGSCGGKRTETD